MIEFLIFYFTCLICFIVWSHHRIYWEVTHEVCQEFRSKMIKARDSYDLSKLYDLLNAREMFLEVR